MARGFVFSTEGKWKGPRWELKEVLFAKFCDEEQLKEVHEEAALVTPCYMIVRFSEADPEYWAKLLTLGLPEMMSLEVKDTPRPGKKKCLATARAGRPRFGRVGRSLTVWTRPVPTDRA